MGLVCGLIFYRIPNNLAGIRSTQAAFYLLCSGNSYLFLLLESYRLTRVDIQLYDREREENLITGLSWIVSRRIAHGILEDFIVPFLFCFIFSYFAGFQGNIGIFLAIAVLIHYITVSFALFCVALLRDFSWVTLMANLFTSIQTYGSCFFAQASTIPVYVRWMKYISYFVSSGPPNYYSLMLTCVRSSSTDSVRHPSTNLRTASMIARMVTHGRIPHAFNTVVHSSSRAFPSRTVGSLRLFALWPVLSGSSSFPPASSCNSGRSMWASLPPRHGTTIPMLPQGER